MENKLNNYQQKLRETSIFKKLCNHLEKLKGNPSFLSDVKKTRKENGIPENGFRIVKTEKDFLELKKKIGLLEYEEKGYDLFPEIKAKYKFDIFSEFLDYYIIFNNSNIFDKMGHLNCAHCVDMSDYFNKKNNDIMLSILAYETSTQPIAIFLHPYMTQRDIVDYVKKMYRTEIEPIQKKYRSQKTMLGLARKKSEKICKRNEFIYNNRTRKKELVSLIAQEFGQVLDYTYINQILSEEIKKREIMN